MILEKLDVHVLKKKRWLDSCFHHSPQNSSKWIPDLITRPEIFKAPKNEKNSLTLILTMTFGYNIKSTDNVNRNKWDYIELESFCSTKETISKMKRQPVTWEKIFGSHIFDNVLISEIHKKIIQYCSKQTHTKTNEYSDYKIIKGLI